MGTNRTHTFGPGSLEDIKLIEAPAHHERFQGTPTHHRQARVVGTFRVYCGMGNEHTVAIKSPAYCLGCHDLDDGGEHGRPLERWELADAMVQAELEDWFDPCDVEDPFEDRTMDERHPIDRKAAQAGFTE